MPMKIGVKGLKTAAVLAVVLVIGVGGAYLAAKDIRAQAELAWDHSADAETRRLTGTLVQWIETTLAPIHALAALFQSSDQVFDEEFWDTVTLLEDNQPDFFPSSLVVARPSGFGDFETWEVVYSVEYEGRLTPGTDLGKDPALARAVAAAQDNPGQTVIGSIYRDETGTVWLVPAIAVEKGDRRNIVLGLIDLTQMIDGLFEVQAPEGLQLRLLGRASDSPDEDFVLLHGQDRAAPETVETVTIRNVAGLASFRFLWDATTAFEGGGKSQLADIVLAGGTIATVLLGLLIGSLMRRNEKIERLVGERTAALNESRGIFKTVLENMPAVVFLSDRAGKILLSNKRYEEVYGLSSEDLTGKTVHDLFPKERADDFSAQGRQVMEAGTVLESENTILSNGEEITQHKIMFPIFGEDGAVNGCGGIEIDVTERVKSEETARQLREAIESFSDGIILFDKDERVIFTNEIYHELYPTSPPRDEIVGWTQEALLRRVVDAGLITDPQAKAHPDAWVAARLESRRKDQFYSFETVQETGRAFLIRQRPTSDGGMIVAHTDITDRRAVEQKVEANRALLDDIISNLQQAVVLFDKDQRLVACNAKYPDILKIDESVLQPGLPFFEITLAQAKRGDYGPGDPEELARNRVKTLWRVHTRGDISFGDERSFDADASLMPDGGLLITYTDITERKRMEEALKSNEKELRYILENSPIAIAISVDDQSEQDGIIQFANGRFVDMLGFDAKDIGRIRTREFFSEREGREEHERQLDQGRTLMNLENRIKRQDGTDLWALMSISPIQFDDRQSALIWLYDITERRTAEKELAEKEAQLRTALGNMSDGLYVLDSELNFVLFNERYLDIAALPANTIEVGTPFERVARIYAARGDYGPGDVDDIVDERLSALTDGAYHESDFVGGDGTRAINLRKAPLENGGAVVVLTDVTERKEAEKELAEKEAQLRAALVNMSDGIYAVDRDLKFVLFNQRAMDMSGLPMDEVGVGSPVETVIRMLAERGDYGPGDVEQHVQRRLTMLSDGKYHEMEFVTRANDRVVNLRKSPLTNGGAVVLLADVTERKRQEERFKSLLESAPDATVIVNQEGAIVQTNLQTEKLFGYKTEELLGQKVEILVPERFRKEHPAHRDSFFKNAGVRPMGAGLELYGRSKDGAEFPIELSLSPIETDEGLLVSGAIRDITERKKAEAELRLAKEQAESALVELKRTQVQLVTNEKMASLGQLTAGIAHEIKNPLNFVNNFSETSVELLIELAEALEPVQETFDEDTRDDIEDIVGTLKGDLEKINHHGKRADHIVKSMLLHARGDTGERVPTAINQLVDEAFNLAYHGERARDKSFNVTMEQKLDEAAGEVELLPQDITRVLVNLFGNAFYAVKQRRKNAGNGAYEPTVTVLTKDKGEDVEIRVRDNGTGMPKEVREKLFEPFFTTKPTGEGTGLGLSMSFDIIAQQHGGHIDVDSEPGAFTEFVISLPRHAKEPAGLKEKEQTA